MPRDDSYYTCTPKVFPLGKTKVIISIVFRSRASPGGGADAAAADSPNTGCGGDDGDDDGGATSTATTTPHLHNPPVATSPALSVR